ncbi:unnamed protein product, partial [Amoebophrya sp. A25]|eukprot:GSA25T00015115001.1
MSRGILHATSGRNWYHFVRGILYVPQAFTQDKRNTSDSDAHARATGKDDQAAPSASIPPSYSGAAPAVNNNPNSASAPGTSGRTVEAY